MLILIYLESKFGPQALVDLPIGDVDSPLHVSEHVLFKRKISSQHYDIMLVRSLGVVVVKSLLIQLFDFAGGCSGIEGVSDVGVPAETSSEYLAFLQLRVPNIPLQV